MVSGTGTVVMVSGTGRMCVSVPVSIIETWRFPAPGFRFGRLSGSVHNFRELEITPRCGGIGTDGTAITPAGDRLRVWQPSVQMQGPYQSISPPRSDPCHRLGSLL
jgi:hypothetical protein